LQIATLTWDILPLLIYSLAALAVGWYNSRDAVVSLREYAVGYTSISTSVLVCGILATSIGAGTVIGTIGELFYFGQPFAIVLASVALSYLISSRIFAHNKNAFSGCYTISHLMYKFYGNTGRVITTLMAFIVELGLIEAQMLATALILSNLLGITQTEAVLYSFFAIIIFSIMGGIRTITQIGVLQFSLFFLVLPISCTIVSNKYGGYSGLNTHLSTTVWEAAELNKWTLATLFICGLLPDCMAPFIQKCLIARNKKQLEDSLKSVAKILVPILFSLWFIAYLVKAINPSIDPNSTIFFYINELAPPVLKGLISTGLIAIIMGNSDGILHAISAIFANDVVKVLYPNTTEAQLLFSARISIVIFCCAALGLTLLSQSNVFSIIYAMYSFWHPIILIPLCAGILGFRTSHKTFSISCYTAIFMVLAGYWLKLFPAMIVLLGVTASAVGFFGSHFIQEITKKNINLKLHIKRFLLSIQEILHSRIATMRHSIKTLTIFPKEDQMKFGQRQLYNKFCVSTLFFFYVYMLTIGYGTKYEILVLLLSIGYIACSTIMIRNVLFKGIDEGEGNQYFRALWYFSLSLLPTVASYAILCSESSPTNLDNVAIVNSVLLLIALGLFTNVTSFMICLSIGFITGFAIYYMCFGLSGISNSSITFAYIWLGSAAIGLYLLLERETVISEEINRMQMVGGSMAHEVKTPMAINHAYASTVCDIISRGSATKLKTGKTNIQLTNSEFEELNYFLNKMIELSVRGSKTVDMLLMTMRNDMQGIEQKNFNLLDAVNDGVLSYVAGNQGSDKKIDVKVRRFFYVYGSKEYMANVIQNLVKNAFSHGGPNVKVKIYSRHNNLIVEDNGSGIPPEVLPMIFGSFYTKSQSGTGLGLAFTKMVIKEMGGSVICKSEEGKYTRFIITLPISKN
jgi:Na+/proline symporter/signal transduction histidine kinase